MKRIKLSIKISNIIGLAQTTNTLTEDIVKFIQNNYRRRKSYKTKGE